MSRTPSVYLRAATALLEVFVVAVVLAFLLTVSKGTLEMQVLATGLVTPIIIISLVFIRYCRRGKV